MLGTKCSGLGRTTVDPPRREGTMHQTDNRQRTLTLCLLFATATFGWPLANVARETLLVFASH